MKWFCGIVFIFFAGQQPAFRPFLMTGNAQGTTYKISYYALDSLVWQSSVDSIFKKVDSSLSIYKSYSLISAFNQLPDGVEMDEHLAVVIKKSLEIYHNTQGIADPTVFPLVAAWGFGAVKPAELPDSAAIRRILPCVGAGQLTIEGNFLKKKNPCVQLDLNGIAQGYTVDLVADFLEARQVQHYMVEIGGEIRVRGKKYPSGEAIKLGIEAPLNEALQQTIIYKIITPPDGAITSSGNYRKFFMQDGKKIAHLINPVTGYPFNNELISVTVYAKKALIADGYDNALMGMGLKDALQFMKAQPELEAYFIYRRANGSIADTATKGFRRFFAN
jgi:FAD:protein FMN transferase